MRIIDSLLLRELAPHYRGKRGARQAQIIYAVAPLIASALQQYQIDTLLRQAHFLAQVCEESFGLSNLKEEASGAEYEGRVKSLGNTQKGDGVRFKGRGLIQLTGRRNYAKVGAELGLDLVANPALAETPSVAIRSACQYWIDNDLNPLADRDDIIAITRRVNGRRMLGLQERKRYLAKAKALLNGGLVGDFPEPGATRFA